MQRRIPPGMKRATIVAAIKNAGHTLEELSKINGFSRTAVSVALCKPWPKVEQIIAATIGVPAHVIWPPRYDRHGMPIKRGSKKESRGMIHGTPAKRRRVAHNLGSAI